MSTEFRVLGRLEVIYDGRPVELGRRRERCLLGVLLLHTGQVMSTARLVDLLWSEDDHLPHDPVAALRTCVSRLRTALQAGPGTSDGMRLITVRGGYRIELDPAAVDAHRFRVLVDRARLESDPALRAAVAAEALALWRGPVLADVATETLRRRIGAGLAELRLVATALSVDAELAQGRHHELIGRLHALVAEHPTHEPLVDRLMLALHRAGRHSEALEAFQQLRARLADTLGTDPGPALQDRYRAILRHDPALDAADRPSRHTNPVPRQLPADIAGFVGREGVLKELDALVDRPGRAVVISAVSGTAGVGKTALAVHWAHQVADRFPDGQLYVNLRGFDPCGRVVPPAEAVRGFLDAFGVPPERLPASLDGQAALYRSLLADRRILVVLDNARDAEHVRPLLPGTPTALTVVTSRNQLASLVAVDAARPVILDVLSTEEARDLLARRLGGDRVAAEPDAAEQIIVACARLPLALAIAAARAHQTSFSLSTLAGELAEAGQRLDALDAGDATSHLRAVFSWSYRAVTPPAGRLFGLLGLHPGPDISVAAAGGLAGKSRSEVRRLLSELARANLIVEHAPGRYIFHDLLRAYAHDLIHTSETDDQRRAAVIRMLDHYLHTAYTAEHAINPHRDPIRLPLGPPSPDSRPEHLDDSRQATAWLTAERAVLLATLRQAGDAGFDAYAWQLAWALDTFLDRRGHWHDELAAGQSAVRAARGLGDPSAQADAHRLVGRVAVRLGHHADASTHFQSALELYIRTGNSVGQARTHHHLAYLADRQGQRARTLDHAKQALALFEIAGHRRGQADALNAVGWSYAMLGDHTEALAYCSRALSLFRQAGDRDGEALTWDSLGYAHRTLGHVARAVDCYERALTLFRDLGDRYNEAEALVHLGDTHHIFGNGAAARDHWQQALDILADLGHPDAEPVRTKLRDLSQNCA